MTTYIVAYTSESSFGFVFAFDGKKISPVTWDEAELAASQRTARMIKCTFKKTWNHKRQIRLKIQPVVGNPPLDLGG